LQDALVSEKKKIIIEFSLATAAVFLVIVLVRYAGLHFQGWESSTFIAIPLVAAILLNLPVSELGIVFRRPLCSLKLYGLACLIFLPAFVVGYFLLAHFYWEARIVVRFPPGLPGEAAVQFLYLALPEEFLFRGYLQKRLVRVLPRVYKVIGFELPLAGIICAGIFAAAHVVYDASLFRILVFFPALVFAWLRHRTDSLLAPVLFHGTCNIVEKAASSMFRLVA
jgi:membrane protease YdiL (CAAX protease family)